MPIKGLTEIRRLPRLGVIRLGIKAQTSKGTEYPKAVDYFVCPEEVQKIYGEKPKVLDIILPLENVEDLFPQFYKRYGKSAGLKCKGDGELANEADEQTGEFTEIECLGRSCPHYEKKECKEMATLNFILPKVKIDGIYQLHTSSYHSIVKLNSSLEYIRGVFGKVSMIPLQLVLEETETHPDKKMKKIVYTLRIAFDAAKVTESISKRENLLLKASMPPQIAPAAPITEESRESIKKMSHEGPQDGPQIINDNHTVKFTKKAPKIEPEEGTVLPNSDEMPDDFEGGEIEEDEEIICCDMCEKPITEAEMKASKGKFKDYDYLCNKCKKSI